MNFRKSSSLHKEWIRYFSNLALIANSALTSPVREELSREKIGIAYYNPFYAHKYSALFETSCVFNTGRLSLKHTDARLIRYVWLQFMKLTLWVVLWIIMNPFYMWRKFRVKFIEMVLRINYNTLFWSACIDNGRALYFVKKGCCRILGASFTESVIRTRRKSDFLHSSLRFEPVNSESQSTCSKDDRKFWVQPEIMQDSSCSLRPETGHLFYACVICTVFTANKMSCQSHESININNFVHNRQKICCNEKILFLCDGCLEWRFPSCIKRYVLFASLLSLVRM